MSSSSLVSYTRISPNKTVMTNKTIKKFTIHHAGGDTTVEALGTIFAPKDRQASSQYGIGSDGRVGQDVDEKDRAWTSSSSANDGQAITVEVANDTNSPNWTVSEKAYNALIDLIVDCCKRNPGITQKNGKPGIYCDDTPGASLTFHKYFAATGCAQPYLWSKRQEICAEVNKRLNEEVTEVTQDQFEKMYAAMMSKNAKGDTPSPWAKEACEAAKAAGVFQGDGQGNYGWQNPIDRESLAVVLHRAGLIEG